MFVNRPNVQFHSDGGGGRVGVIGRMTETIKKI